MVSAEKFRKLISELFKPVCHYFKLYLTNRVWKIIKKMIKSLISAVFLILTLQIYAQPELEIEPGKIEFEDVFHRFKKVYFINEGNQSLAIDSISYLQNRYFLRWDLYNTYPIWVMPGDTLGMDCILSEYYNVTVLDTVDTMFVYVDYQPEPLRVKMKINFYEQSYAAGTIKGTVTDAGVPAANIPVYFMKDGVDLFSSTNTDVYGRYEAVLPPGEYLAAASFNTENLFFSGNTRNPFSAAVHRVKKDSIYTVDISRAVVPAPGFSISGVVVDSISGYSVGKGVVVIRKGKHNPNKPRSDADSTDEVYAAVTGFRGVYTVSNIENAGHYFAQAFSNYFVPSYFTADSTSAVFWQQADSIFVNANVNNVNFAMKRDSAFGDGRISGVIQPGLRDEINQALLLYASSPANGLIYSSGIGFSDNSFILPKLPYGIYDLRAQSIYNPDLIIASLEITPQTTSISNVTILLTDAEENPHQAGTYLLMNNYPNPFNPGTRVSVELQKSIIGEISLFSISGEKVLTLIEGELPAGKSEYLLNLTGYSSGVYFLHLQTAGRSISKKIVMLK